MRDLFHLITTKAIRKNAERGFGLARFSKVNSSFCFLFHNWHSIS